MAVTFIDISVHPMVRPYILSSQPALVWSADMSALLWANAEGARLMGESRISNLLDLEFATTESGSPAGSLAEQMQLAAQSLAQNIANGELATDHHFGLRKNDGLVRFTLDGRARPIVLGDDGDAVLMVFEGGQRLGLVRPGDQNSDPVHALLDLFDDQPGCAAILDKDGSLYADRGGLSLARFRKGDLGAMHRDVQGEGDLLIKRVVRSEAGAHPAGIALLEDGKTLVLIAGDVLASVPANLLPEDGDGPDESADQTDGGTEDAAVNRYREPSAFARRTSEPADDTGPRTVQLADMERIRRALTGQGAPAGPDTFADKSDSEAREVEIETEAAIVADVADDGPLADSDAAPAQNGEPETQEAITAEPIQAPTANRSDTADTAGGLFGGLDYWYFRQPRGVEQPSVAQADADVSVQDEASLDPADEAEELIAEHEAQIADVVDGGYVEDLADDVPADSDDGLTNQGTLEEAAEGSLVATAFASEETHEVAPAPSSENTAPEVNVSAEEQADYEAGGDNADAHDIHQAVDEKPATPAPIVRFAFTSDADGNILSTSPEFAAVVGTDADPQGYSWQAIQSALAVDADGRVASALSALDTWSGRHVSWPLAGTDRQVPVEMGALPNFSRTEGFTGFRGFGVLRVAEESADPAARGLSITWPEPDAANAAEVLQPTMDAPDNDEDEASSSQAIAEDGEDDDFDMVAMRDIEADVFSTQAPVRDDTDESRVVQFARSRSDSTGNDSENDSDLPGLTSAEAEDLVASADEIFDLSESNEPEPLAHLAEREGDPADLDEESAQDAQMEAEIRAYDEASRQENSAGTSLELQARLAGFEGLEQPVLCYQNERVLFANQALLTLTGYESAAAIDAIGGLASLLDDRTEGPDGPGPQDQTMMLTCADGQSVPVAAHLRSIKWAADDGEDTLGETNKALVITLSPVDETSPQTEEATLSAAVSVPREDDLSATLKLGLSVPQLHEVLATATDGVVVLNAEGRIHALNGSAEALFGFESESLSGRNFATLFSPDSQPDADKYLASMMGSGVEAVLNDGRELTGFEASGGLIPLFVTLGRLAGTGDRVAGGFCAVLRDITQWKKVERDLVEARQEAEDANQKKSDFLAQISHEIRTPLNAIIGFSEVMAEERFGPLGSARYSEYLRDINRSGTHVLDLINDLLDISKIESGGLDLDPEEVDLNDVVASCVSLMQPEASAERVIMRTSLSTSVPRVLADTTSVRQIALNLLSNAVKFTSEGGQVIISTARMRTGEVELRIRDTGVGMSRDELEHALKPYRQLSNGLGGRNTSATQDARRGTGLGLPLTKAMVEANGAEFAIHSEPGQGTWVVVAFPKERVLSGG